MLGCAADGWGRSWDGGGIGGDPTGVRRDRGTTGTPRGSPGIAGNGGRCLWGLWGLRDMKGPDRNGTGPETGAGDSGEPGRAVGQQSCSPPVCPRCPPAVPLSVSFVTPRLCRVPRDAPGSGAGPSPVFAQGIGSGCGPGGSPGGPRLPTVLTSVPGGTGVPRDAVSPLQPGGGAGVWGGHRCPVCVTAGLGVFVGGIKPSLAHPGARRGAGGSGDMARARLCLLCLLGSALVLLGTPEPVPELRPSLSPPGHSREETELVRGWGRGAGGGGLGVPSTGLGNFGVLGGSLGNWGGGTGTPPLVLGCCCRVLSAGTSRSTVDWGILGFFLLPCSILSSVSAAGRVVGPEGGREASPGSGRHPENRPWTPRSGLGWDRGLGVTDPELLGVLGNSG